jgi:hypothetical protein
MAIMDEWCIPSNNGWRQVKFEALVYHRSENLIEYKIELAGQCWRPSTSYAESTSNDDLVDEFRFALQSVLISMAVCKSLLDSFDGWLNAPAPFTCKLCSTFDQSLILSLGDRDDLITKTDHPACTIEYESAGGRVEVFFVVDQSCIRIARQGLARIIQSLYRPSES